MRNARSRPLLRTQRFFIRHYSATAAYCTQIREECLPLALSRSPDTRSCRCSPHPTQRTLAILAAAERGAGADEATVRGILARALTASRGPQWCCDKCSAVQESWQPICPDCGGFDTLSWREPPHESRLHPGTASDLAPMLFGRDPEPVVEPEPQEEPPPEEGPAENPDEILRRSN